jgi:2'-5' RNA ligase
MPEEKLRTFLAVETSRQVRARAGELMAALQKAAAAVKWVTEENLHITLNFLGDVPAQNLPEVFAAVGQAAKRFAPFELEIRGAGAFPHLRRPQVIWLGAGEGQAAMVALQAQLAEALAALGFPKEDREYHPHLTLGRVRRFGRELAPLAQLLEQYAQFQAGRFRVSEVVVFSSRLTSQGPIYQPLHHATLVGG